MKSGHNSRNELWIPGLIILAGLAFRLWLFSWPLERQIGAFVADDAFYYTQIAHNILAGSGPTFDGQIATNGFHPLWMMCCVFFQIVAGPDPESVLRLMLLSCAFLSALSAVFLLHLCRRFVAPGCRWAAWLACLYWAANPFIAFTEMMGVEAPLALVFTLAAVTAFEHWNKSNSVRTLVLCGVLTGLAFLSRTDTGLLGLIFAAAILMKKRRRRF